MDNKGKNAFKWEHLTNTVCPAIYSAQTINIRLSIIVYVWEKSYPIVSNRFAPLQWDKMCELENWTIQVFVKSKMDNKAKMLNENIWLTAYFPCYMLII